jgi:hypothetical protein
MLYSLDVTRITLNAALGIARVDMMKLLNMPECATTFGELFHRQSLSFPG